MTQTQVTSKAVICVERKKTMKLRWRTFWLDRYENSSIRFDQACHDFWRVIDTEGTKAAKKYLIRQRKEIIIMNICQLFLKGGKL